MEITIFNERKNSTDIITFSGTTVKELLHQLKINAEIVLITRNNEVLTEEEKLQEKDTIEILSVISGG